MPFSLFGRRRHKMQQGSPYSMQTGENLGNGAKGFVFIDDFNLPKYDPLIRTAGLNFTPPSAFQPGAVKYQLLSLTTQGQQGFPFNPMEGIELTTQDEFNTEVMASAS
jgi:hypothetical protein